MVSDLKWRTGFGWSSLLLFLASLAGAILLQGFVRGAFAVLVALFGTWLAYRFHTWNGLPWRKVHFRAMLLYSVSAGKETQAAQDQKRPFSVPNACKEMAMLMCGSHKGIFVDAMMSELLTEKGAYFRDLLRSHGPALRPNLSARTLSDISSTAEAMDFCPQLVIGNIIENTYGPEEAARYVLAVLARQAY
ncbi:MAG: hypothetical protein A3G93_16610 [Nitrospinae bacterium RIFCSPLOWO2_12_FULL_45_22]|nr:MAG: hypothetical protein A3G93_16610 [Nitrospinae bacterium RIFCSPLOWO2_12_FULL_45_22]